MRPMRRQREARRGRPRCWIAAIVQRRRPLRPPHPVVVRAGAALRRAIVAAPAMPARHRAAGTARAWVLYAVAGGTKPGMPALTVARPPRLPGHGREEPWPNAYLSGHDRERHSTS